MPNEAAILRLSQRARKADELIEFLTNELTVIKNVLTQRYVAAETARLKEENMKLKQEVEIWKARLIEAELRNNVKQVPLPSDSKSEFKLSPEKNVVINAEKEQAEVQVKPFTNIPDSTKSSEVAAVEKPEKPNKKEKKESAKKEKPIKSKADEDDSKPIDVSRLDLRIGRILSAEKHPDADSLYVEKVDVGEEKPRTVVSGLVKFVPLEKMQNRLAVLLCNLKPAKMRGVLSEAMVMCASTPDKVEILDPPPECTPGEKVICENYPGSPDVLLNPKKKIFEQVAPDLKTDAECVATYKGSPLKVNTKGIIKAESLAGVQIK